jgi:hypothetical protein
MSTRETRTSVKIDELQKRDVEELRVLARETLDVEVSFAAMLRSVLGRGVLALREDYERKKKTK